MPHIGNQNRDLPLPVGISILSVFASSSLVFTYPVVVGSINRMCTALTGGSGALACLRHRLSQIVADMNHGWTDLVCLTHIAHKMTECPSFERSAHVREEWNPVPSLMTFQLMSIPKISCKMHR